MLDAPAAFHELAGQPVEQFRMAWRRSLGAEVVVGLDEPASEVRLPDPVDGHPGRQRIAPVHQPAGQVHAVGRRARALASQRREDRGHPGSDHVSLAGEIAPQMHVRRTRVFGPLPHDHRGDEMRLSISKSREARVVVPERRRRAQHQLDQGSLLLSRPLARGVSKATRATGPWACLNARSSVASHAPLPLLEVWDACGTDPGGTLDLGRGSGRRAASSSGEASSRSGSSTLLKNAKSR